jgi:hypothetical protein
MHAIAIQPELGQGFVGEGNAVLFCSLQGVQQP